MARKNTLNDFWAKVDKQGFDDCWNWKGYTKDSTGKNGYGKFKLNGRTLMAHRVAYELTKDLITPGLVVRHKCDNRACCNPNHLEVGTLRDNSMDCVRRGRHAKAAPKGEKHGRAKLTEHQVKSIKLRLLNGETHVDIARDYSVSRSTISLIAEGKHWRHVKC